MAARSKEIPIGLRVGTLEVLARAPKRVGANGTEWMCLCHACGKRAPMNGSWLRSGRARSCGCLHYVPSALAHTKHGEAEKTPEWHAWVSMKRRCYSKRNPKYNRYGGRGITVCSIWLADYKSFLAYMGRRPSTEHSLDRYPNQNGNYEPGNVRWATQREQQNNRTNNLLLSLRGETCTAAEWGRRLPIDARTIVRRVQLGWSDEDALTTSIRSVRRKRR